MRNYEKIVDLTEQLSESISMPIDGICKTIGSEAYRAIQRIAYRLYNDGDVLEGYGAETTGSEHSYLRTCQDLPAELLSISQEWEISEFNCVDNIEYFCINVLEYIKNAIDTKEDWFNQENTTDSCSYPLLEEIQDLVNDYYSDDEDDDEDYDEDYEDDDDEEYDY